MNPVFQGGVQIITERKPGAGADFTGWQDNSFGSRSGGIEPDPNWKGFSIPEWMLINTTDGRKGYR